MKSTANLFVNVGDTFFGSGAGVWNKYLDDDGEKIKYQKERKERYFTTKPLHVKFKKSGELYQNKQTLMIPTRFAMESRSKAGYSGMILFGTNRIEFLQV